MPSDWSLLKFFILLKTKPARNSGWFRLISVPLGRLELPFLAPEANALSTELQGRASTFYHENMSISNLHIWREADQLRPQILNNCQIPTFLSEIGILPALEGIFAADLEKAGSLAVAPLEQRGCAGEHLPPSRAGRVKVGRADRPGLQFGRQVLL